MGISLGIHHPDRIVVADFRHMAANPATGTAKTDTTIDFFCDGQSAVLFLTPESRRELAKLLNSHNAFMDREPAQ